VHCDLTNGMCAEMFHFTNNRVRVPSLPCVQDARNVLQVLQKVFGTFYLARSEGVNRQIISVVLFVAPRYDVSSTSYVSMDNDVAAARRISGAALDDTDAMMAASRRHDQQLLNDINARLVGLRHSAK